MTTTPKIYVACLAAYNNGKLHGAWVEANQGPEALYTEIQKLLKVSPEPDAEEWAIHDYEGFGDVSLSEWPDMKQISKLAAFINERGELGSKVLSHFCGDLDEAVNALENYAGEYKSLAYFAQEITEETTQIPTSLQHYIDYQAMARDMELNSDVFTIETGFEEVHIFWTR